MFKKKFKVRIRLFSEDKYVVQYAYYRIIPLYKSLCFWFSQTLTGGTECWSTNMWPYEVAEEVALSLKCMGDVDAYYKPYDKEKADFKKEQKEYYERHVPYQCKQIK